MEGRKAELLARIERDRELLIEFLREFIRCPSPNPPGDTLEGRRAHPQAARRAQDRLPGDRAARADAQHRRDLRRRQAGAPSGAQRPHRRLPGRRRRRLDARPVGRRAGRRQDLWPRRLRHEVRHHRLDLHFPLSQRDQGRAARQADPVGGVGRGDLRPLRRALPRRAPSRDLRRHLPQRRAVEPVDPALRREGPAVAGLHGQDQGRARRLHPRLQERDPDRRQRDARARAPDRHAGARGQQPRRRARPGRAGDRQGLRRRRLQDRAPPDLQPRPRAGRRQGQHGRRRNAASRSTSGCPTASTRPRSSRASMRS